MKTSIIIFCLFLFGCKASDTDIPFISFDTESSLTPIRFNHEIITQPPSQIELIGTDVVIFRPGDEAAAKRISTSSGEELGTVWYKGRGPEEYIIPYFAGQNYQDSTFCIYDINKKTFSNYKWINEEGVLTTIPQYKKTYSGNHGLFFSNLVNDKYTVSRVIKNPDSQNVLILLDENLNYLKSFCNPLPQEKIEDLSYLKGPMASKGNILAYAALDFGYIGCFEIGSDAAIHKKWEYYLSYPKYEITGSKFKFTESNPYGFFDIKMTDKYILGLYSGNIDDEQYSYLPQHILVFDYDGNPVTKIDLGEKSVRFAIDEKGETLYTLSFPSSRLLKYDLSTVL